MITSAPVARASSEMTSSPSRPRSIRSPWPRSAARRRNRVATRRSSLAASSPRRRWFGAGSSATGVTGWPRSHSEAAISQPMKPEPIDHHRVAGLQPGAAARAGDPACGGPAPRDRRRPGSAAGLVPRRWPARSCRTRARGRPRARPSGAPDRARPRARTPGRSRCSANQSSSSIGSSDSLDLPAQQLLGQRRALIGRPVLVGDDRHRAASARLAVGAGGGQTRRAPADHQEVEVLGHRRTSTSSR